MASNSRRRMQRSVSIYRNLESGLAERRPSELLMLSSAAALVLASEDLSAGLVSCNRRDADSIALKVRDAILEQVRQGIRSDPSGLDEIGDPVSRLICQRQVLVADQVHMMAAVLLGVEAGLRAVVAAHTGGTRAADENADVTKPTEAKRSRQSKARAGAPGGPNPTEPPDPRPIGTAADASKAHFLADHQDPPRAPTPVRPDTPDL